MRARRIAGSISDAPASASDLIELAGCDERVGSWPVEKLVAVGLLGHQVDPTALGAQLHMPPAPPMSSSARGARKCSASHEKPTKLTSVDYPRR
eukprot:414962-Pleurochrysis_carterae.AAC.1